MRTPIRIAVVALLGTSLLGFSACDGGTSSTSGQDSTTVVTPSTNSSVVVRTDTIASTQTTVTIVRRKLLVNAQDSSTLSLDTLTYVGGTTLLDTSLSGQQPCSDGLTVYNLYGTEVTMELWAGRSLGYAGGMITGSDISQAASNPSLLADRSHNRWCTRWRGSDDFSYDQDDLLLVVGVPLEAGGASHYLVQGHFPEVTGHSILVLDEVGRLRTLR